MAKYLDYEDVRGMLENLGGCGGDFDTWNGVDTWDDAIDTAISELNSIPAADVQEVVRCKDCINHDSCEIEFVGMFGLNSFCCLGKRKDEEENG